MTRQFIGILFAAGMLLASSACQPNEGLEASSTAAASETPQPSPTEILAPTITLEPVPDAWFLVFPPESALTIYAIEATEDGGLVAAGAYIGEETTLPWVGKFDRQGGLEWQRTYGTAFGRVYAVAVLPDGGYAVGGFARVGPLGTNDLNAVLFRLDEQGEVVWGRYYGGDSMDNFDFLQPLEGGRLAFAGYSESFANGFPGDWVGVIDDAGEVVWHTMLHRDYYDMVTGLGVTERGELLIGGWNGASWDAIYATLAGFDSAGEILFDQAYDKGDRDSINTFLYAGDGVSLMGGDFGRLSVLDAQGAVERETAFDTRIGINDLARVSDGYILAGSYRISGVGNFGWVMRVTLQGEVVWARQLQGVREMRAVTVGAGGNILLLGHDDSSPSSEIPILISLTPQGEISGCEAVEEGDLRPTSSPRDPLTSVEGGHRVAAYPFVYGEAEFMAGEAAAAPEYICQAAGGG